MARVWDTTALVALCVFFTCWRSEAVLPWSQQASKKLPPDSQQMHALALGAYDQQLSKTPLQQVHALALGAYDQQLSKTPLQQVHALALGAHDQQLSKTPLQQVHALALGAYDQQLSKTPLQQVHAFAPGAYDQQQQMSKTPLPQPGLSQKCNVDGSVRIACGEPGLNASQCEALNCCFDGQNCYYGRMVTVQCTRDGQFVLVVAKDATLPRLSLDSVSLMGTNGPCGPVDSNAVFAIYQFPVTACGTRVMELPGYLVYENKMISSYEVGMGPLGAITRDSHYELYFQCRYYAMSVGMLTIQHYANDPPLPVVAPGPLRVELRLANGQCATKGCVEERVAYTSYYQDTDYPVTKVLREPVYVEVRILGRSDPHIVLTLGDCWATSSPNPFSLPQWKLLVNGCPYKDDRYLTTPVPVEASSAVPFPTHYKRFVLMMFTFVDSTSMAPLNMQVYIHCSTAVCYPSATESCDPGCSRHRRHVPEEWEAPPESAVVSSGAVVFTEMA